MHICKYYFCIYFVSSGPAFHSIFPKAAAFAAATTVH